MGVVDQQAFEEPFLGVLGGDLDAVDDCLLLQVQALAFADAGQGDLLGSGLADSLELVDLGLELPSQGRQLLAAAVVTVEQGEAELGVHLGQVPAEGLDVTIELAAVWVRYDSLAVNLLEGVADDLVQAHAMAHVAEEVLLAPAGEHVAGDQGCWHAGAEAGEDGELVAVGGAHHDPAPWSAAFDGDGVLGDPEVDALAPEAGSTAGEALSRQVGLTDLIGDEVDSLAQQPLEELAVVAPRSTTTVKRRSPTA